ncbi:MAG TPA: histidine phosphatase family protein [Albidovulum sp.]|uniref:histidine phosphatase family protein n=1 Tax=Albidovulum sp. TaxID=1872424 RepID=UPI002C0245E5|nr:histidine phosphatase family protein [Albidovulum sp.]
MIYLLRHGQTEFNLEGRLQGQLDSPLTDFGRDQARACGALIASEVQAPSVWTSPLVRAAETARLVAAGLPGAALKVDPRLAEASFGIWEGLTRPEIDAGWPGIRKRHPPRQWKLNAPEGEGIAGLMARLASVLKDAGDHAGDVVLVSHGIAGRLIRGLHGGMSLDETVHLPAPQGIVYRLHPGGRIDELASVGG